MALSSQDRKTMGHPSLTGRTVTYHVLDGMTVDHLAPEGTLCPSWEDSEAL